MLLCDFLINSSLIFYFLLYSFTEKNLNFLEDDLASSAIYRSFIDVNLSLIYFIDFKYHHDLVFMRTDVQVNYYELDMVYYLPLEALPFLFCLFISPYKKGSFENSRKQRCYLN